jgi:hypothetical protein
VHLDGGRQEHALLGGVEQAAAAREGRDGADRGRRARVGEAGGDAQIGEVDEEPVVLRADRAREGDVEARHPVEGGAALAARPAHHGRERRAEGGPVGQHAARGPVEDEREGVGRVAEPDHDGRDQEVAGGDGGVHPALLVGDAVERAAAERPGVDGGEAAPVRARPERGGLHDGVGRGLEGAHGRTVEHGE